MSKASCCLPLLLLAGAAGCVEKQIEEAFDGVQQTHRERMGQELEWNQDPEAEERIAQRVMGLLEGELTADRTVEIALLNNRRLQATYSDVGIAAAQLVEAWLIRNPVVTGQIRFAHHRPLWEFEMVQNFLDVLLLPLSVSVAEAELEATKLRVSAEVIDVAMETRRTFIRYQARRDLLRTWQEVLLASESAYDMAVQLRRAGNISELRLAREQTMYEQLKLDIAEVQLEAIQDRERLNVLMGLWGAATMWEAAPELAELPDEPMDLTELERRAVENSLDLKAALYNLTAQAQRLGLDSIQAAIPQLQLGGAVESERPTKYKLDEKRRMGGKEYELEDFTIEEWQAGPAFSVPIPVWNLGQAAYGTARMELLRRWNLYTAMAINIRASARAHGFRVATSHQRAVFNRKILVPVWDNVFEETQLQYNAMFVGVFDLLHAKEDQLRAHQRYIASLAEYWLARTDLEQLLLGSARGTADQEGGQSMQRGGGGGGMAGGMQATLDAVRRQARSGGSEGNNRN
jgi:cobalt-zinc-cadmium efflux system outer membrane protein